MNRYVSLLAMVAVALAATAAHGDTWQTDPTTYGTVTVNLKDVSDDSGTINTNLKNGTSGPYKYNLSNWEAKEDHSPDQTAHTGLNSDIDGNYWGFCVQLDDVIYYNHNDVFAVRDLQDVPTLTDASLAKDGDTRGDDIAKLWQLYRDDLGNDPDGSGHPPYDKAMSALIWEVVHESSDSSEYDISSGTFKVTGGLTEGDDSETDQVATWIKALENGAEVPTNVLALYNPDVQNGSISILGKESAIIPEPVTVVKLLGLGMMGVVYWLRRRRS